MNKRTPCIVSEKNWGQRKVHDACIVHTAVGEKAHLGMKRQRTVKKSSL